MDLDENANDHPHSAVSLTGAASDHTIISSCPPYFFHSRDLCARIRGRLFHKSAVRLLCGSIDRKVPRVKVEIVDANVGRECE